MYGTTDVKVNIFLSLSLPNRLINSLYQILRFSFFLFVRLCRHHSTAILTNLLCDRSIVDHRWSQNLVRKNVAHKVQLSVSLIRDMCDKILGLFGADHQILLWIFIRKLLRPQWSQLRAYPKKHKNKEIYSNQHLPNLLYFPHCIWFWNCSSSRQLENVTCTETQINY